jgi:hypothetical protein
MLARAFRLFGSRVAAQMNLRKHVFRALACCLGVEIFDRAERHPALFRIWGVRGSNLFGRAFSMAYDIAAVLIQDLERRFPESTRRGGEAGKPPR